MNAGIAAVLSLLDGIFILKEEQKNRTKGFSRGCFRFTPIWLWQEFRAQQPATRRLRAFHGLFTKWIHDIHPKDWEKRLTNFSSFLGAYTQIKQIVLSVENFAALALSSSSNSSHCLRMKQSRPIVGNQNHPFSDSGREDKTAAQLMSKVQVAPSCQQLLLQTS